MGRGMHRHQPVFWYQVIIITFFSDGFQINTFFRIDYLEQHIHKQTAYNTNILYLSKTSTLLNLFFTQSIILQYQQISSRFFNPFLHYDFYIIISPHSTTGQRDAAGNPLPGCPPPCLAGQQGCVRLTMIKNYIKYNHC